MSIKVPLTVIALALATCGCGASDESRLATALAQTRVAEAPLLTATALARPTPTPSPRPPTPSPTPGIEATLAVLASVTLEDEDLPRGFEPLSFEELGASEAELRGLMGEADVSVGAVFSFLEDTHFQFVLGFTVLLPDRLSRASFDAELKRPETLLDSLVSSFEGEEITDKRLIPASDSIGDASAGVTVGTRIQDAPLPVRMEVVTFRTGNVGVFIFEMYVDGERPQAPILDLAATLDAKIRALE